MLGAEWRQHSGRGRDGQVLGNNYRLSDEGGGIAVAEAFQWVISVHAERARLMVQQHRTSGSTSSKMLVLMGCSIQSPR